MQSPWDILRNSREEVARQGRAHRVLLVVIRSGESAGRKDNLDHMPRCMRERGSGRAERSVSEILGVRCGKNIGGCGARVEEPGGPEREGQIKQILCRLSRGFSVI